TDEDPFVRRLSAEGLGQLADKHSCSVLISALEDKEAIVREAAFKALVKLSAKRIPFDPEASETQRRTMVKRWRAWWDKEAKK
ncbi:MAG: HEAT repeat domain-containing protein, partial [Planctomycetota bacterium]|nr:HEAT repeat domain-containing protein [Planctomycetota bacterium]